MLCAGVGVCAEKAAVGAGTESRAGYPVCGARVFAALRRRGCPCRVYASAEC